MTGIDMFLRKAKADNELKMALASIFDIPESTVAIISDVAEYVSLGEEVNVVCERRLLPEGLPLQLSVNWSIDRSPVEVVRRLACILDVECLFPSQNIDPYEMTLISPAGSSRAVCVNISENGGQETYTLDESTRE